MWLLKKNTNNSSNTETKKDTGKTTDKKSKKTNKTAEKKKSKDIEKPVDKKKTNKTDKAAKKEKQTRTFSEKDAKKILTFNKAKAKELLKDKDSMNDFLREVDNKFDTVTGIKEKLSYIPIIVSLIRSYMNGEYRKIPVGSLIGLIAALIYFVSPIDLIPDFIPVIGQLDEMMVLALALKFASTDLEDYKEWSANQEA